jgi:multidrug efflux pump subunit AcrB
MGIVRLALRFPHTFYVLAALILFLGATAIVGTATDIFPQINIPVVTVIWQYTGLSTPEMEQRVTAYSQYSISSNVTGIKNIEAQTLNGISVQKIYFQPDVNLDLAIAQVVSATNAHSRAHAGGHPAADHRGPAPLPTLRSHAFSARSRHPIKVSSSNGLVR